LYYSNLAAVSENNELEQWIKFFLVGITETAVKSSTTLRKIISLRENLENEINSNLGRRAPNAHELLKLLYIKPVLTAGDVIENLKVSKQTAHTLLTDFEKLKILKEQTGFSRNRVFYFAQYIHLFEKR
ncbi:MAG: Fic family protein, partial [Bacteroidota bacterium]